MCQASRIGHGGKVCQTIPGAPLDEAITQLLLKEITPANLEISLQVEEEIQRRHDQTDRARTQAIEQLRYETQLAQRRYLRIDPDNRLVAAELEASWNEKLTSLQHAQEERQRLQAESHRQFDEQMRQRIRSLAQDFPRLWNDSKTPQKERKRMVRLLIEDVTVHKALSLTMQIRFKGGALRTMNVAKAKTFDEIRKTDPEVIKAIDKLTDDFTPKLIAQKLNEQKLCSGTQVPFSPGMVKFLQRAYALKPRYDRLRERGYLDIHEMAQRLKVCTNCVKIWRRHEILIGYPYNDKNECLFESPDPNVQYKLQGQKHPLISRKNLFIPETTNEVQYEA